MGKSHVLRRHRRIAATTVLLIFGGTAAVVGAYPASAAGNCGHGPGSECTNHGSHITVTPFKGLINGQTVTIKGTGFVKSGRVSGEMCKAIVRSQSDCDSTTAQTGPVANGTGAFSGFKFKVSRIIHTPHGNVTCNTSGNCSIGVISNADFTSKDPHTANEDVGIK